MRTLAVLDVAPLLAEVIRRLHRNEPLEGLRAFNPASLQDFGVAERGIEIALRLGKPVLSRTRFGLEAVERQSRARRNARKPMYQEISSLGGRSWVSAS